MSTRLMRTSLLAPSLLAMLFLATGNAFGQINTDVVYQIKARHSQLCLDVSGGSLENKVQVIQWPCHGGDNQKWTFTAVGDYYHINAKHSGKSLDVFGGIFSKGKDVMVDQWDYNGADNQLWKLQSVPNFPGYYWITAKHSGMSLGIMDSSTNHGAPARQYETASMESEYWTLIPLTSCP